MSASLLKTNQLTQQLQQKKNQKDFSLDCFKNDNKKICIYTGFVELSSHGSTWCMSSSKNYPCGCPKAKSIGGCHHTSRSGTLLPGWLSMPQNFLLKTPSSLAQQSATLSSYKNHNTFKVLIGISPDGTMFFISNLYEGSVSDVDLVSQCGLLALLEQGDSGVWHIASSKKYWCTFEHTTLLQWEPVNDSWRSTED